MMEYLVGPGHEHRPPIDGGIMQAPVSDREAMIPLLNQEAYEERCKIAQEMVDSGRGEEIMPPETQKTFFSAAPVCARRFLSLASPNHDGDDDYFSSDLSDEQFTNTFGRLPARSPLCIIFSGSDEFMAKNIDKAALIQKWIGFVKKGNGKVDEENSVVLDKATHNLAGNPEEVVSGLIRRVVAYLDGLLPQSNL